jgi:hypothetical protein
MSLTEYYNKNIEDIKKIDPDRKIVEEWKHALHLRGSVAVKRNKIQEIIGGICYLNYSLSIDLKSFDEIFSILSFVKDKKVDYKQTIYKSILEDFETRYCSDFNKKEVAEFKKLVNQRLGEDSKSDFDEDEDSKSDLVEVDMESNSIDTGINVSENRNNVSEFLVNGAKSIGDLTVQDLYEILKARKFNDTVLEIFMTEEIDGGGIRFLNHESLKEIKIPFGQRIKLLGLFEEMMK